MITPEDAVERIGRRFGVHAGARSLHARGVICSGRFRPAPEAATLTRAAHMQGGEVPVLARLSNGSGDPGEADAAPDVRGLAVSFELPDGERTDIVSQSAPRFPVRTPEAFMDLLEATAPGPASAWRMPLFLARNPSAIGALRANAATLKAPVGYGDIPYYAVHAYRWVAANGDARWVRYTWRPRSERARRATGERGPHYLADELRERLPQRPLRFDLEVQLAAEGDDPHDPTSVWPDDRERLVAGTLEISEPAEGHDGIIFDPMRLTAGIEPSDDPILRFRPAAYSVSYDLRTGSQHERPPWAR